MFGLRNGRRWLVLDGVAGGAVFALAVLSPAPVLSPALAGEMQHRQPPHRTTVPTKPTLPGIHDVTRDVGDTKTKATVRVGDAFEERAIQISATLKLNNANFRLRLAKKRNAEIKKRFLENKATMQEVIDAGYDVKFAGVEVKKAQTEYDRLWSYGAAVTELGDAEARLRAAKKKLTEIGFAGKDAYKSVEDRRKAFEKAKKAVEAARRDVDKAREKVRKGKKKAGVTETTETGGKDGEGGKKADTSKGNSGTGDKGGKPAPSKAATVGEHDVSGVWTIDEKAGTQTQTFDDGSSRVWKFDEAKGRWVVQSVQGAKTGVPK